MEFTAANKNLEELGVLRNLKQADIEIGDTNTFELTLLLNDWNTVDELNGIDCFYCPGTEIGGKIRKLKVMTEKGQIKASGRTWRGNMMAKVLEPPDGEAFLIASGEANEILRQMIDPEFDGLIIGSKEESGFVINNFQFERYCTMLDGVKDMLASVGAKLKLTCVGSKMEDGEIQRAYVEVSAVPITDYSDKVEFTKDGRIHLTATDDRTGVNHLVCLGKGELTERLVLHLYIDHNGNVSDTQFYTGIEEIAEKYEYSSVDDVEELRKQGEKRLIERKNKKSIEITPNDIDVGLDDIVSGKEDITGISMKTRIIRIIYKINTNGFLSKQYKVGE